MIYITIYAIYLWISRFFSDKLKFIIDFLILKNSQKLIYLGKSTKKRREKAHEKNNKTLDFPPFFCYDYSV